MTTKRKPQEYAVREHIPCAHTDCSHPAILSRKLKTGWAKLCKKHDLFHAQLEANEFCEKNNLFTYEEKRDWILKKLPSKPTPYEHWMSTMKTSGLIHQSYEMAKNYLARHLREDTGETKDEIK